MAGGLLQLSDARCRFVQITDVHFIADGEPDLTAAQVAAQLCPHKQAPHLMNTMLRWALRQICEEVCPDFIIFTGDQVDFGTDEDGLANHIEFRRLVSDVVSAQMPVYYACGNRDRPRERFLELYGQSVYGFECNGCHFTVLDSGATAPKYGPDPPELFEAGLAQLETMLREADGHPAAAMIHFSPFPPEAGCEDCRWGDRAIRMIQQSGRAVPVLSGHLHRGRVDVVGSNPYFNARALVQSPYAFYLHELTREGLTVYEYLFNSQQRRWRRRPTRWRFDLI
jgi:3',5'-cyclic AMP phosphodiesterase CpdA